jgi:ceramide synthetase
MFIEVRRKDWAESFAHHLVTLGLLYYSFAVNFTRPGLAIAVLHDVSDIFLEAAKLSRYGGRQTAATAWFAAFAASWIACRVVVYPRTLVLSCLRDPIVIVALPYGIDPQVGMVLNRGGGGGGGGGVGFESPFGWFGEGGGCNVPRHPLSPTTPARTPPTTPQPHYSIFATLLLVLYFLHLYWTWLILQVVWRQVRGQAAKDVREDDDDSDSD